LFALLLAFVRTTLARNRLSAMDVELDYF